MKKTNKPIEVTKGWFSGHPTEPGIYLRASDEDELDETEQFEFYNNSWFKDGAPWFCYGGVWKRIGDLPAK